MFSNPAGRVSIVVIRPTPWRRRSCAPRRHRPPSGRTLRRWWCQWATSGWSSTSGQIALDPRTGAMVEGDVEAQARQVLGNLGAVLAAAGAGVRARRQDHDLPREHGRLRDGQRGLRGALRVRPAGAVHGPGRAVAARREGRDRSRSPSSEPGGAHVGDVDRFRADRDAQLSAAGRVLGAAPTSRASPSTRRCIARAGADPEAFWAEMAGELAWAQAVEQGARLEAARREVVRRRALNATRELPRPPRARRRARTRRR